MHFIFLCKWLRINNVSEWIVIKHPQSCQPELIEGGFFLNDTGFNDPDNYRD